MCHNATGVLKTYPQLYDIKNVCLVLWLWETTHIQEVVGSKPGSVYWLDMTFFTLIRFKNCIACMKRPKYTKKRLGLAHKKQSKAV